MGTDSLCGSRGLAQTATRACGRLDHLDDVRAGRFVIMVLAKRREQRMVAADVLNANGAEFIGFYGRWAWEGYSAVAFETESTTRSVDGQAYGLATSRTTIFSFVVRRVDDTWTWASAHTPTWSRGWKRMSLMSMGHFAQRNISAAKCPEWK